MGGFAARKALNVVENTEIIIAIELLAACQGLEYFRPLKSTEPLQRVYDLIRMHVAPLTEDRFMTSDIETARDLIVSGAVARECGVL